MTGNVWSWCLPLTTKFVAWDMVDLTVALEGTETAEKLCYPWSRPQVWSYQNHKSCSELRVATWAAGRHSAFPSRTTVLTLHWWIWPWNSGMVTRRQAVNCWQMLRTDWSLVFCNVENTRWRNCLLMAHSVTRVCPSHSRASILIVHNFGICTGTSVMPSLVSTTRHHSLASEICLLQRKIATQAPIITILLDASRWSSSSLKAFNIGRTALSTYYWKPASLARSWSSGLLLVGLTDERKDWQRHDWLSLPLFFCGCRL